MHRSRLVFALSAVLLLPSLALAGTVILETQPGTEWQITVDAIPQTLDEYMVLRDALAKTPQGALAAFLVAAIMLGDDDSDDKGALKGRRVGEQALITILHSTNLAEVNKARPTRTDVKGYGLGNSMINYLKVSSFERARTYVGRSYVVGTKPDDGYALPPAPYRFVVTLHAAQTGDPNVWKGMSRSSGADNPKPFDLKKNDKGVWKVDNPSSFFAGCKPPPQVVKDDL